MRRRIAAAVTAASAFGAACLSIPPFQPTVLVSYKKDGAGAIVAGSNFSLHFGSGSGFPFPDDLRIDDSRNLLGRDDASLCYDESGAGFSLYPTPRISANTTAPVIHNDLVAVWSGPAVVQVRVDWETQFSCNRARAPKGSSTFTVFPDGRIIRHDQLSDTNPVQISASACACDTDPLGEFIIESYWTFTRDFQSSYSLSANAPPQPASIPTARNDAVNVRALCLDNGPYQLASLQVAPKTRPDDSPQIFGTNRLIGHRLQQPLAPGNLDMLPWDIYSALFVEHGGCTKASKRVFAYTDPPSVTINEMPVQESLFNGIYGGDPGADGERGFLLPGGHGMLKAQAVPFAVWLRFPSSVDGVHAILNGETGAWYTAQRVDDRNWILWVHDFLAAGQEIQLEPL